MKKFIMISMIALAAAGFTACGGEETDGSKADLKWINKHDSAVSEIQWLDSSSNEDQTWSGDYPATASTDFKGIETLTGKGECLFSDEGSGVPVPIVIDETDTAQEGIAVPGTNAVTVTENASAVLVIGGYAKK